MIEKDARLVFLAMREAFAAMRSGLTSHYMEASDVVDGIIERGEAAGYDQEKIGFMIRISEALFEASIIGEGIKNAKDKAYAKRRPVAVILSECIGSTSV